MEDSSSLKQQNDDSEILKEWEELIRKNSPSEIKKVPIETITQWLEHSQNKEHVINWKDDSVAGGNTMLHCALQYERLDIAMLLLEHDGADLNIVNEGGDTALILAIRGGHNTVVEMLLNKDVDCKITNKQGRSAFTEAYYQGNTTLVDLLLEKAPLQDIVPDIVKFPEFADKFLELYLENRDIVNWRDGEDRIVGQVACKECRKALLFLGQYDMEDRPVYESPTCTIYTALDYGGQDEDVKQPRHVAMKFFRKKDHFENEMRSRREDDGSPRFSSEFVTPDLAAYRADQDPEYAKACRTWKSVGSETDMLPDYCLVMPLAGRSLWFTMNAENLSAMHKDIQRRPTLFTVCKIFSHLHEEGYVHGDIQPHNIVRHMDDDGNITWKAVDFDSCTKIGDHVGLKLTTGSAPPEMLKIVQSKDTGDTESMGETKVILRQPGGDLDESDLVKADPSFDVWSFGILMFQLVTGRTFFHCDNQGNLPEEGLHELASLTQDRIYEKLERVKDRITRVLLSQILRVKPNERPTMSDIEKNYYFNPSESRFLGDQVFSLHRAGQTDTMEILLNNNADLNATDDEGNTLLMLAVLREEYDVVETLLDKGVDCKISNKQGRTAFKEAYFQARQQGRTEMVDLLLEKAPLQDIVHDIAEFREFANKFSELYQENRDIVNWRDKEGRTVRQIACKECREGTLFLGQYDMDDKPMYVSPTCKIYNALDYGGQDENLKQPRKVAMKFMKEKVHFLNEIRTRRKGDGSPRFSSEFVTCDLAAYRADQDPDYAKACETWKAIGSQTNMLPDYCLVMPLAERSLVEAMDKEDLSTPDKDLQRREILLTLGKVFLYLHEEVGYVHGDIKPHNVVRHIMEGNVTWKAIDFDACTKTGDVVGLKLTTGFAPPEVRKFIQNKDAGDTESKGKAKVILRQPGGDLDESDLLKADPSFDVWSYGILMYELVTDSPFFHCDKHGNVADAGLQDWATLTQNSVNEKLALVKDVDARVLLSEILRVDPEDRPKMSKIVKSNYFHPSESPQGRKADFIGKQVFSIFVPEVRFSEMETTVSAAFEPTSQISETEHDDDPGSEIMEELESFLSSSSEFSYFKLRDEDKDWSDKLLNSEVETFQFDKLGGMGEKPEFIDGETIYNNTFLRRLLSKEGPDYFMGFLVEYFELYKIMHDAHEVCQGSKGIKANLVSDVKSLKGIFIKLFVRGKGLNDIVRGTLFCNSIDQFKYVGRQLKEVYGHNVYIKPPKQEAGAWPIPKLLIYGNNRIDGRCMSVEIQFSTIYMHLALHASNSHVIYEAMRESTGYLDDKDDDFRKFLLPLNQQIDTEGFLRNQSSQEGRFEIIVEKIDDGGSGGEAHSQEGDKQYTTEATGFILSGRVRCGDQLFEFMKSKDDKQRFSESSFVVNKSLTLLSSHSYWSKEAYDLEGKSVEFAVSFKGRGLAIAGIGTAKCFHGLTESDGGGARCSVHVGRSKFLVRKSGVKEENREKKLPNQERAKIIFKMKERMLSVSFVGCERGDEEELIESVEVSMPSDQRYYLYMRAPPGVHDVKFHDINIRNCSELSNDGVPAAKMDKTGVEGEAIEEPKLGEKDQNQSSVEKVVEEVSVMSDSSMQEFSNRQEDHKLHWKLDEMERKLDKMEDMDRKLDELVLHCKQENPKSSKVEKKVPIFEGWLSKQSRNHSYLWQDRYFEVYAGGDVMYYPKGVYPGDQRFGVKLYQNVRWSKINGGEGKLELRSPKKSVVGMVKLSNRDCNSTVDEWLVKGNSWMESPSSGVGKETKSTSKPRPKGAQTTAAGDINTLYA